MKKIIKTEMILNYLKENNLTKKAFCQKCKIGTQILNKILRNQTNFNIVALFRIARQLEIEVCELFVKQ